MLGRQRGMREKCVKGYPSKKRIIFNALERKEKGSINLGLFIQYLHIVPRTGAVVGV